MLKRIDQNDKSGVEHTETAFMYRPTAIFRAYDIFKPARSLAILNQ